MKKLFKAAASLAIGCAMLQASAFAALTGNVPSEAVNGNYTVTVSGVTDQSTILITKSATAGENGTYTIPSNLAEANIVYINQVTAENSSASYTFAPGNRADEGDTLYVFAGGTGESSATYLGQIIIPSESSGLPEGTAIVIRNADPYDMDGYSVVSITGITSGSVKVIDEDGEEIDAYLADYSKEESEPDTYIALVKGSAFTVDNIVYDAEGTAETIKIGNVTENDEEVDTDDANEIVNFYLWYPSVFDDEEPITLLAGDVNGDGAIDTDDANEIVNFYLWYPSVLGD